MSGITLSILEFISFLCAQNSNQLFLKRKITNAEMSSLIKKADEDVSEQVKRVRNFSLYDPLC
jgi:plasmid rolling circle replication initiator protein Rep